MPTFRRSRETRALSVGCILLFAILEITHLGTGGSAVSGGGLFLAFLLIASLGGGLLNLGDRYRVDDEGVDYSNPLLGRLGIRVRRRVAWSEVVSMRVHHSLRHGIREDRPAALFLYLRNGRRLVIDSLERFDEVLQLVARHLESMNGADSARPSRPGSRVHSSP